MRLPAFALGVLAAATIPGCSGCRRTSPDVPPPPATDASAPVVAQCTLLPRVVPIDASDVGAPVARGNIVHLGVTLPPETPKSAPADAAKDADMFGGFSSVLLRRAAVLTFDADAASVVTTVLGTQLAEDPPPRVALSASGTVYAAYARWDGNERTATRAVTAGAVANAAFTSVGKPVRVAASAVSFDVAEKAGVLLLATSGDGSHGNQVLVSDPQTGAALASLTSGGAFTEDVRIVADASGFSVAWVSAKPEASDAGDGAEGPGEERTQRWVEGAKLGARGECTKAPCAPVRLSKTSGHVGAFDLTVENGVTVLYLRDDEERHVGQGSDLYLRRWPTGTPEAAVSVRAGGVGGRAFDVVAPDLVAYVTPSEEVRIASRGAAQSWLALDAGGTDIRDGLLATDVRVLAALTPTAGLAAPSPVAPSAARRRLLVLRGHDLVQLECAP